MLGLNERRRPIGHTALEFRIAAQQSRKPRPWLASGLTCLSLRFIPQFHRNIDIDAKKIGKNTSTLLPTSRGLILDTSAFLGPLLILNT